MNIVLTSIQHPQLINNNLYRLRFPNGRLKKKHLEEVWIDLSPENWGGLGLKIGKGLQDDEFRHIRVGQDL